jgi:hypothetical protein
MDHLKKFLYISSGTKLIYFIDKDVELLQQFGKEVANSFNEP